MHCLAGSAPCIIKENGLTECHSNTAGLLENLPEAALVSWPVRNPNMGDFF